MEHEKSIRDKAGADKLPTPVIRSCFNLFYSLLDICTCHA